MLKEQLKKDEIAAMKARDKARVSVLRMVSAEIKAYEVNNREDISDENVIKIIEKSIKQTKEALEYAKQANNEEKIQEVVETLESAETVFLYGVGASSLVVEDILQKWSRVGKPIIFEKDIHVLLPQLVSNETKKVLWLVSNSGSSADVVAVGEIAKDLGIEVIALTQFGNNPLSKLADVVVQTSRPKEITNRSAATNSLLAQFVTIDIIFYLYMTKNEQLGEKVRETRQVIKGYFGSKR